MKFKRQLLVCTLATAMLFSSAILATTNESQFSLTSIQSAMAMETETGTVTIGEKTYNTIDSAISAAKAGDVITLSAGNFIAPTEITKSVTIKGAGSTRLESDDVTVLHFDKPLAVKTDNVSLTIEAVDIDADVNQEEFKNGNGLIELGDASATGNTGIELTIKDSYMYTVGICGSELGNKFMSAAVYVIAQDSPTITIDNSYLLGRYTLMVSPYTDDNGRRGQSHDTTNAVYTITDSTLVGWTTGNMRGENTKYTATNSVFYGENVYSGASNSYSTFVMSDGAIGGDYTFNNCTITAKNTGDQKQKCFTFQYGARDNTLTLNKCTYEMVTTDDVESCVVFHSPKWISETYYYPEDVNNDVVIITSDATNHYVQIPMSMYYNVAQGELYYDYDELKGKKVAVASIEKDGVTQCYSNLSTAITNAEAGDTVKLMADITLSERLTISNTAKFTLDGNGHKISYTYGRSSSNVESAALQLTENSNVTLKNMTIDTDNMGMVISGTAVIDGVTIENENKDTAYGIAALNSADIWIKDADITTVGQGIATAHGSSNEDMKVIIDGGTYISNGDYWDECPIYWASKGYLEVNGGTFTDNKIAAGLYAKNGTIVVNGGTFTGKDGLKLEKTSDQGIIGIDCTVNGGEFTGTTRAGLYLSAWSTDDFKLVITDGKFTGAGEYLAFKGEPSDDENVVITGGLFNEKVPTTYVAGGYVATTEAVDGYYTIINKVAETVTEVMDAIKDLTTDSVLTAEDKTAVNAAVNAAAGTVAAVPNEDLLDHLDTVNKVDELLIATGDVTANGVIDVTSFDVTGAVEGVNAADLKVATDANTKVKGLALAVVGGKTIPAGTTIEVTLNIKQTRAAVSEEDGKLAASITYDIKPKKTTKTTTGTGDSTKIVSNDNINAPITFKLHLPAIFADTNRATVKHDGKELGKYTVYHYGTENYIWITTTHFSEFVVSLADNVTYGSVKKYTNELEVGKGGDAIVQPLSAAAGTTVWITPKADEFYRVDEVIVDGGDVKVTDFGDGTYSYVQPSRAVDIEVIFEDDGTGRVEEQKEEVKEEVAVTKFADVKAGAWYEEYIAAAVKAGIMQGNSDTEFAPNGTTTRAMMITVLFNMEDQPATANDGKAWYSEAQAWAIEAGVSDGSNMAGNLTREQLVTMLYRYAMTNGEDTSATADLTKFSGSSKISAYAVDAFKWAVAKGIINGDANGNLNPQGTATRAELAKIMVSYLGE